MSRVQNLRKRMGRLFRRRTDHPEEPRPQSPWRQCEKIVQEKFPKYNKGTEINIPPSAPEVVQPILARATRKEIPALLCKVISDVDNDRLQGKRLAKTVLEKVKVFTNNPFLKELEEQMSGSWDQSLQSLPVSAERKTRPAGREGAERGIRRIETRNMTRAELQQFRTDFAQKETKDVEYMLKLWNKGANSRDV